MNGLSPRGLENFRNHVGTKFQLYNSLFTSLPFHRIEKTGILLALFLDSCEEGYRRHESPQAIVDGFFEHFTSIRSEKEKDDLLFRFVQYVERQIVLFDALEDAAFREINDFSGTGSMKQLESRVVAEGLEANFLGKLDDFAVSLVLTAHPTQFYPGSVLGIINDLARALKENNTALINVYLQQLGKTPLFKKQKPTPYDEAVSLIWYLENVFYSAIGKIITQLKSVFPQIDLRKNSVIKMGFWPGGDRDGNPNVTADITLKVADALRTSIIKCYYLDVRKLKKRLTFRGVDGPLAELEAKLYNNLFVPGGKTALTETEILDTLFAIRDTLIHEHNSLFLGLLDNLICKVEVFGLHFASLDVRQESSVHGAVLQKIAETEGLLPAHYEDLPEKEKMDLLVSIEGRADKQRYEGMERDTIASFEAIAEIQAQNGQQGSHRYIISQCHSALNVLEVYGLFLLSGWKPETITADIVPLFETIDDLAGAPAIMEALYSHKGYRKHLKKRGDLQHIMVGFSDGTKDGGYLMANWSIFKAKEALTKVSTDAGVKVIFFDGRGGPPGRGGGKTHKFYASMGRTIQTQEIHLTVQGQTISSNFGNVDAAMFNIEQLLNAGISNALDSQVKDLRPEQEATIRELAEASYEKYKQLKNHPYFSDYLTAVSPLNYYSETNISSRPAKRGKQGRLSLQDLRAIPFVGAWSQMKQNVPGYYGFGTALKQLDAAGKLEELRHLYQRSPYFKTIVDNCEMAMKKSFFPLTAYLSDHPLYGEIWNDIREEFELTKHYLYKLSGTHELMKDYPVEQLSIQMREKIVLPLTTVQQYALTRLREDKEATEEMKATWQKLVVRTSFGIINAGRNSA